MTRAPTPLTVIGGYLGSGKTTLVNRLLANPDGRRIAVLVNDFGSVNIDAELIVAQDGDTVSLANGCVCCSFADGLAMALVDLRERIDAHGDIDHVVIEVSGVGDPWKVAQWGRTPGFNLDGVVVLAAADTVREKSADPLVGDTVLQQLRGADMVLVTRADLVDDARPVVAWMGTKADALVWAGVSAEAPVDLVLGRHESVGESNGLEHHRFATWSVEVPRCAAAELEAWLRSAPAEIWRAKGIIGCIEGLRVAQRVGHRVEISTARVTASVGDLVVIAEATSAATSAWSAQAGELH